MQTSNTTLAGETIIVVYVNGDTKILFGESGQIGSDVMPLLNGIQQSILIPDEIGPACCIDVASIDREFCELGHACKNLFVEVV